MNGHQNLIQKLNSVAQFNLGEFDKSKEAFSEAKLLGDLFSLVFLVCASGFTMKYMTAALFKKASHVRRCTGAARACAAAGLQNPSSAPQQSALAPAPAPDRAHNRAGHPRRPSHGPIYPKCLILQNARMQSSKSAVPARYRKSLILLLTSGIR